MLRRLLDLLCAIRPAQRQRHSVALLAAVLLATPSFAMTCVGDRDGDGAVTVAEIIWQVNDALSPQLRSSSNAGKHDELLATLDAALHGCPAQPDMTPEATATAEQTPTEITAGSPTATATPPAVPTQTIGLTPTETATGPPDPPCDGAPVWTPKPSSPCVSVPGTFVDCFRTSGLDFAHYEAGENGAAVADIDGDGFPDVFFWSTSSGAQLFRNLGHAMQFERVTDSPLVWLGQTTVRAAAFGDLDNDGKPDLVVLVDRADTVYHCPKGANDPLKAVRVYRNSGQGKFEEVSDLWGFGQTFLEPTEKPRRAGLALVDLNLDGRLDVVEYGLGPEDRPRIFLSQPSGTSWMEAGRDIFGETRGINWTFFFTDSNHDQLQDLFVLNDPFPDLPSRFYARTDRSLSYAERELPPLFGSLGYRSPMGAATADLNGDGELDLVVTDSGDQHVFSLGNNVEDAWGVKQNPSRFGIMQTCWSVGIIDLENDGTPDLFFGCAGFRIGFPDKAASFVLRNKGGVFEVAAGVLPNEDLPSWDEGLAVADFDQDGRVDLLTGGEESPPRLLWNQIPAANALAIRLKGKHVNAQGIGTRIDVAVPGLPPQARELFPGGTTWGYGDAQLFFGIGQATHATVTVDWRPAGGTAVQTVELTPGTWVIEEP